MNQRHSSTIREPEYAGKFYPGEKKELQKELEQLFEEAKIAQSENKKPQAIISPHAGYIFSGKIAASAFKQVPRHTKFKRVFVFASSHQVNFKGASVFTSGHYKTPLGIVKVDLDFTKLFARSNDFITENPEPHLYEHSLEVQLPFIQFWLDQKVKLVPVIMGSNNSPEICKGVAKAFMPYFTEENLFVVSTDFSHYPDYADAVEVDSDTAKSVISNNPEEFLKTLEKNKKRRITNLSTSMCGWTSVLTLMYMTEGNDYEYTMIDYANSGDNRFYNDKSRVVGYHAIAVYNIKEGKFSLSEKQKEVLLEVAHRSLSNSYGISEFDIDDLNLEGILQENLGAFVSLYEGGELRGCIGQFKSEKPLWEVIKRMAVSASNDRRFEKPGIEKINKLSIEISVLSPLKQIKSADEIELGKHGIYIKSDFTSGTFLPQVAEKTGWTKEEFLGRCSRDKAGLGWNGWKSAELFVYEAEVFSDNTLKKS